MKPIDAEVLDTALTKRIKFWMGPQDDPHNIQQAVATTLIDVRQVVREAAGIDKDLYED